MEVEAYEGILPAYLEAEILVLYREIFGDVDEAKFRHRMNAERLLTLVIRQNNSLAGYKIGYPLDSEVFYSWLGAVSPPFRQRGIARLLMERQHAWCKENGFQTVRTKTYNRWKNMLILNLQCGFDIVGLAKKEDGRLQIVLEKRL
ncbi:MAG: GNAT family N-acetyltransferase [Saprospiraceae bacterium]